MEKLEGEFDGDKEKVEIAKLNVDSCPTIADRYGVEAIPTIIIFYRGTIMWRFVGLTTLGELKGRIDYLRKIVSHGQTWN